MAHNKKLYQIEDSVRAAKVMVQERIDGSMLMTYKGRSLGFKEITERPVREKTPVVLMRIRKTYIPPANHPWRKFKIRKHRYDRGRPIEPKT